MKKGLTLVEILVAIILCGIVVFIAIQMITGEHKNYTKTREKIRLQGDARDGIRILEEEIKNTGYRTNASIGAGRVLTTAKCSEALYGTTNSSFDPAPSYATGGVTGFEIRLNDPSNGPGFDCAANVWTIGYKYDPTQKILYRQAKQGDPTIAANAIKSTDWIPLLEGVSSFSLEYGLLQERSALFEPSNMPFIPFSPYPPFSGWGIWHGENVSISGTSTSWSISTQSAALAKAVFIARPLTASGNSADGARNEPLNDKATYRLSFSVSANDDFFDDVTGLSTSTGGATSKFVTGGFYYQDGTPSSNLITFRPVKGGSHAVQYDISPAVDAGHANAKVFFGVSFQMMGASTASRTLTLSDLKITRLNKGEYSFLASGAVPTTAQRPMVQAIRLKMTAKSKNDELNFNRIIPMVNNGL